MTTITNEFSNLPLTNEQKERNKQDAMNTVYRLVLEYIMNGGQLHANDEQFNPAIHL